MKSNIVLMVVITELASRIQTVENSK